MGIQGLLPQLKSIMAPIGVEDLGGLTVAVDTYSWLHKGALSCSLQLCKGLPTTRHIEYCMHRVNLLRHHGVKPILVFDGGFLPMKSEQENKRSRSRKENLERAMEHEATGNKTAAFECYQKAVDISPSIALQLIQVLKEEKVDYIVAPYEADAQMAFLSINKLVDVVITEDSDLIPFGCSRIIFKMDKFGQGVEFHSSILEKNKDLDFTGFTKQMLLEMCIFSGCDYLQSLPGMGVKRAHSLVKRLKSYEKVIKHLRYSAVSVPPHYEENFKKAIWAFQHQRVYDPSRQDIVHLSDLSPGIPADLEFLGPWLPQAVAKGIAEGSIDPLTKMPFQGNELFGGLVLDRSEKATFPAVGRKKLDLPVQKNILTNYFCLASLEAKRKFRAPKILPQELVSMGSSSQSYKSGDSEPSSQETTYANKHSILPKSEILGGSLPEKCPRSTMETNDGMSFHNPEFSITNINDASENMRSSLLEMKDKMLKPILAAHKERGCNAIPNVDQTIMNSRNRKVMGRSSYFKQKVADKAELKDQNVEPNIVKNIGHHSGGYSLPPEDESLPSCMKKRKMDVYDQKLGVDPSKDARASSLQNTEGTHFDNLNDKEVGTEAEGKFGCDISHLSSYSGIAEKTMDSFAALISSFRYSSSGSRASGLRPPKRAHNIRK